MEKNPRILVVGPLPPPAHGVSVLNQALLNSEFISRYAVHSLDIADRRGLVNLGVLDWTNFSLAIKHSWQLFLALRHYSPQVVVIYISQGFWGFIRDAVFIWMIRIFSKATILCGLHGSVFDKFYDQSNRLTKILIRATINQISAMTVLGHKLRTIFDGLLPDNKVYVVPNGIPENTFADAKSQAVYLSPNRKSSITQPIILYLSALDERKGVIDLLRSIPEVSKLFPDAQFLFAGGWSKSSRKDVINSEAKAKDIVLKLNIAQHVTWLGPVFGDEKIELFYKASVFVLPTRIPEGQPVSIIEAMASGLPIITCDRGVIRDLVIDGSGGFIVPTESPEQISKKIIALLTHHDLAKQMGRFNRTRFEQYFTMSTWVNNLSHIVDTILVK